MYLFRAALTCELHSCARDENKNRFMEKKINSNPNRRRRRRRRRPVL